MSRLGLALSIGIFLAAGGLAQTQAGAQQTAAASGNAQANQSSAKLASGSTVNATLDTALDSKKCKVGDTVKARSTEDVKSNGETVLPKGTKLVGHITQASAKAKGDSESEPLLGRQVREPDLLELPAHGLIGLAKNGLQLIG